MRSAPIRERALLLLVPLLLAACSTTGSAVPQPAAPADEALLATIREQAHPIADASADYDSLMEMVGDARVVLIGEASHGTHEFYRERARITRRLIEEKGFTAVAIEGDWPDADRVNRYVRGRGTDRSARAALSDFESFPTWMWGNTDVQRFVEWMRQHNQSRPGDGQAGFYGLDLYSLYPSIEAVTGYLARVDPAAAARARERFRCFREYDEDPVAYGQSVELGRGRSCREAVAEQLRELQARPHPPAADALARDELFSAVRNARAVQGAEEYYRSMFLPGVSTWNLRDRFMMETLEALMGHLDRDGRPAKVVVWAHNSHVGDARATHMGEEGEINIGQLARERWGNDAVLVGFTTYTGTVMAASDWGGPAQRKRVRPSLPGSFGDVFHQAGIPSFLLLLRGDPALEEQLGAARLQRAIGVIYLPQQERVSHYFHAVLPRQFDAVIHLDRTRAVEPLNRGTASAEPGKPPVPGRG